MTRQAASDRSSLGENRIGGDPQRVITRREPTKRAHRVCLRRPAQRRRIDSRVSGFFLLRVFGRLFRRHVDVRQSLGPFGSSLVAVNRMRDADGELDSLSDIAAHGHRDVARISRTA
jgi:hypothetical protein